MTQRLAAECHEDFRAIHSGRATQSGQFRHGCGFEALPVDAIKPTLRTRRKAREVNVEPRPGRRGD